jgi:hypothetical protein
MKEKKIINEELSKSSCRKFYGRHHNMFFAPLEQGDFVKTGK